MNNSIKNISKRLRKIDYFCHRHFPARPCSVYDDRPSFYRSKGPAKITP